MTQLDLPSNPSASPTTTRPVPGRRVVLGAHPVAVVLEPRAHGTWSWELRGRANALGTVTLPLTELVGFGARLAALIGGHRTSAELRSVCGSLRLHVERADRGGALLAFRVASSGGVTYSVGVTRLDAAALQRSAEALLALFDATLHGS